MPNEPGIFKFEKLIIWQKAMDHAEEITKISRCFPSSEMYNLTSQTCSAVDSIALNISEGSIEQSAQEFKRIMIFAIRSLAEVVTCLHKAHRRSYINEEKFTQLYAFDLMNMMIAFKKRLS